MTGNLFSTTSTSHAGDRSTIGSSHTEGGRGLICVGSEPFPDLNDKDMLRRINSGSLTNNTSKEVMEMKSFEEFGHEVDSDGSLCV